MTLTFTVPPRVDAVADAATEIVAAMGYGEDDVPVHAAVSEALLNAILYGSLGLEAVDPDRDMSVLLDAIRAAESRVCAQRAVHVVIAQTGAGHAVTIRDPGRGFDWGQAMNRLRGGALDPQDGGGRGLFIMNAGSKTVSWNTSGNEVTLRFERPGSPGEGWRHE